MTMNYPKFPTELATPISRDDVDIPASGPYRAVLKRTLDILIVLLAAPFVVPLVLMLAAIVSLEGGSPFYAQERVGKGRKVFRMWKLRSMVCDADARMEQYLASDPEARREWDETQKLKNDPRITRFGRVLRKCSFDELPQLWNVLVGDMSLVGPRPMMVSQQPLYPSTVYYRLRPGITGFWQVSGRNDTSFAARAVFDTAYDREVSFRTDLGILLRTVKTVLRGTGY